MAVTTYYMEMTTRAELKEKVGSDRLAIAELATNDLEFCKMLYRVIGKPWHWVDRYEWTDARWEEYLSDPDLRIWVAYEGDELAGFYELHYQKGGNVEVALLGLAQPFIGKGLGGHFLTHALKTAWSPPSTKRVWLHTCSMDHENAISNYEARGMQVYRTEIED